MRRHTRLSQATLGRSRAHGPRYNRIIRVDEVEVRARRDTVEEAQIAGVRHAVPSHVRNLPPGGEPAHGAGDHVEPAALAELLAGREQQLIAETDPEKRAAAVERPAERRKQAEPLKVLHGVMERAVPWEHDGIRLVDAPRILGDRRGHADPTKCLLDGAEVAAPVIDDRDHRLASPAAAARTRVITGSPRRRLRLAPR